MRRLAILCAVVFGLSTLASCSGSEPSLNPPRMDLLACRISIDNDDYGFGDPIRVTFDRDPSYRAPEGFQAIPCHSMGLGAGKIEVLERGTVVHEVDLGMVRVGGVPFVQRVTINKYHLTGKGGSFELRAVCNDWRSNVVGFDLG